jgi:hypothetical protein
VNVDGITASENKLYRMTPGAAAKLTVVGSAVTQAAVALGAAVIWTGDIYSVGAVTIGANATLTGTHFTGVDVPASQDIEVSTLPHHHSITTLQSKWLKAQSPLYPHKCFTHTYNTPGDR